MNHEAELREQTVQSTMLLAIYGRAKASRLFPDIMRDGAVRWHNLDLPDSMAFRRRFLPTPARCAAKEG
jgi:O-methyltransferase involved in polyketide biosynthesis